MAAPTLSTRGTPTGVKLRDGFSSKISFSNNTTVSFWEKDVTPPGMTGNEPIDQSTMHNVAVTTSFPQVLISYQPIKTKVAYDPAVYASGSVLSLINVNGSITVQFPDGSTLTFYGYLQEFVPSTMTKGAQPEAEITIIVTNLDSTWTEQVPVLVSVAGT